jgi:DNA mismatch repair protein MSH4
VENISRLQILLAIARTSFLQCVEDIHLQAATYSQQLAGLVEAGGLEDADPIKEVKIKVKFSSLRGYHLIIPAAALRQGGVGGGMDSLPEVFVQPIMLTNSIACTTLEVSSLSDRAQEAISSALSLTHALLRDTIEGIRLHFLKDLHAFVDSVSLMDMLMSFTNLVHHSTSVYCRPTLTVAPVQDSGGAAKDEGEDPMDHRPIMLLEKSRHPIISELSRFGHGRGQAFVENSVLVDSSVSQVQVVTGVNGCGKSTLIKQIALITILAQIGCFVPCVSAVLPLRDRLFSRLSSADDLENNMSTFHLEMKEIAYILDNVTNASLVIIDELGRGSSNVDGLSVAFAVCEHLALHSTAFILFATHFTQITQLARLYPNIQNVHLKTELHMTGREEGLGVHERHGRNAVTNSKIIHHYSLYLGPFDIQYGYGILVSEHMSLDFGLIQDAKHFQAILQTTYPSLLGNEDAVAVADDATSRSILRNLVKHFALLKKSASSSGRISSCGGGGGSSSSSSSSSSSNSSSNSDKKDMSSYPSVVDCRKFFLRMQSALSLHQQQNMSDILSRQI